MATILRTDDLWKRLRQLSRLRGRALVAVPFVGVGAAEQLKLGKGDVLIARVDEPSARTGTVSPKELLKFLKRGVEIHACPALHAKVFVFGTRAIIGSANLSGTSERELIEAGIETDDKRVVDSSRRWIRTLMGHRIGPEFLRQLAEVYVPPRRVGRRHRKQTLDRPLWVVRLYPEDWQDVDDDVAKAAKVNAKERGSDPGLFRVDSFRLTKSRDMRDVRPGDPIVTLWKEDRTMVVEPLGVVLSVDEYKGPRGTPRRIVSIERRKYTQPRSLRTLEGRNQEFRKLRGVKAERRYRRPTLYQLLRATWQSSS